MYIILNGHFRNQISQIVILTSSQQSTFYNTTQPPVLLGVVLSCSGRIYSCRCATRSASQLWALIHPLHLAQNDPFSRTGVGFDLISDVTRRQAPYLSTPNQSHIDRKIGEAWQVAARGNIVVPERSPYPHIVVDLVVQPYFRAYGKRPSGAC